MALIRTIFMKLIIGNVKLKKQCIRANLAICRLKVKILLYPQGNFFFLIQMFQKQLVLSCTI